MLQHIRPRRALFLIVGAAVAFGVVFGTAAWAGRGGISSVPGVLAPYVTQLAYMFMPFAVMYALNAVEVPDVDFLDRIAEDPVATAIFWGLVMLSFALAGPSIQGAYGQSGTAVGEKRAAFVDSARADRGVTERPPRSNEGKRVEAYLRHVGLSGGYPYCAAAASFWADRAGLSGPVGQGGPYDERPIRTALSAHFLTARSLIPAHAVSQGWRDVPCGAIGVYLKGNSGHGHTVVVAGDEKSGECPWRGQCGITVEANTTPGPTSRASEQRDGGGVYKRTRCIDFGHFRLVGFAVPNT